MDSVNHGCLFCAENVTLLKQMSDTYCVDLLFANYTYAAPIKILHNAPHGGCGRYRLWRSSYSLTVAVTYVLHVLWDLEYGASERKVLTHWVWDERDNILQTTFSSVFSSMKMFEFRLKFVPKGPINNIPALIKIMAWCRPGDKSLSEPMMVSLLMHIIVTRPQWVNYG